MRPLKILLVHDYDTPSGGAEGGSLDLRAGLRARGHDVRLFSSTARPPGLAAAADYTCFGALSGLRTPLQVVNPFAPPALANALQRFQPDLVHVRMFLTQLSPIILPQLAKVPSLYHAVWYRAACPLGTKLLPTGRPCQEPAGFACRRNHCLSPQAWALMMAQLALLRRWRGVFDRVVANSAAVAANLEESGFEDVGVVWNGVAERAPRHPLNGLPTIGFAGRLVREKGVDVLLRAFAVVGASLPEATLLVIGDGPERRTLTQLAADLGIAERIAFTGQLSRVEAERRLEQVWVQAVPSIWAEPFGFVAAEAMMRGTAVVASGHGGLAEIVQHGATGLHVAPRDVTDLAASLKAVLSDRALAERYGAAGRLFALSHLTTERWLDRFEGIYGEVLGGSRVA